MLQFLRAPVFVVLITGVAFPAFAAEAARRVEVLDRRPPIALFFAEKVRLEAEAKDLFVDTMRTMVQLNDDFDSAKPLLQDSITRLDGLRERLAQMGRRQLAASSPKEAEGIALGLARGLEAIRAHERHLLSYAMGRTAESDVRRLIGEAHVDSLFDNAVDPPPAGARRQKPALAQLKPFRQ